ncbi:MAG: aminopeptidase [Clostridiales bacterium]|nr:aminopeptidase [Clostridiales bacterium]
MSIEMVLFALLIVSTLVGLATEALKKVLDEYGCSYHSNTLAGAVSLVLSVVVGVAYMIITDTAFNAHMAVYLIALVFLSWLSAMLGYDKVIQTISQIRKDD